MTDELVEWADVVVVMERAHRNKLQRKHRKSLGQKRVICLDIPDDYEFMDPELVRLLHARMRRHLPEKLPFGDQA